VWYASVPPLAWPCSCIARPVPVPCPVPCSYSTLCLPSASFLPRSYNKVNNEPACLSRTLLTTVLREQLGFKGFVATDCDGALPLLCCAVLGWAGLLYPAGMYC